MPLKDTVNFFALHVLRLLELESKHNKTAVVSLGNGLKGQNSQIWKLACHLALIYLYFVLQSIEFHKQCVGQTKSKMAAMKISFNTNLLLMSE